MSPTPSPEPPGPPDAPRKIRLYPFQWFGALVLAAFPILAIAGVFGESWDEIRAASPSLDVRVTYPTRYRFKQINKVEVWIRNQTGSTMDTVRVLVDSAYLNKFSALSSVPSFEQAFQLAVTDLRPNETRVAIIEIQAERYGRHTGALRIAHRDTARVSLSTFVFP